MINNEKELHQCSVAQNIGETVQICYDSINSELIIINGVQKCTKEISLPDPVSWFAYADFGDIYSTGKISLNLGKENFINTLPQGYEKWYSEEPIKITCYKQIENYKLFTLFNPIFIVTVIK